MKCPVCTEPDLVMTERQGVDIDPCVACAVHVVKPVSRDRVRPLDFTSHGEAVS